MITQSNSLYLPFADQSAQMCVTSPPYYGLRDYGVDGQLGLEETPEQYIANMVAVFREVKRVLKDDGTLWLNIGDSYAYPIKGSGGSNPITSPMQSSKGKDNFQAFPPRKFNMGDAKQKDLLGIPWMLAFALRADGWYLRQDIIWHKPNPMPESVKDRCTKAHEYIFLLSKSQRYYFDSEAIKEKSKYAGDDRGSRSDSRRGTMCNSMSGVTGEYRNRRSVWTVTTKPYKGAHFATFPPDLIEPCILAGSDKDDFVLDPFNGSGTTGQVAIKNGRRYLGSELNWEYIGLSKQRLSKVQVGL